MPAEESSKKGAPIKVLGGTYSGKQGWLNNANNPTECFTHIIVVLREDPREEKAVKVKHENYVLRTEVAKATSYEEAMLQQHNNIADMLRKLTKKMAQCEEIQASGEGSKRIAKIFLSELEQAIAHQQTQGGRACWRHVRFTGGGTTKA